LKFFELYKVNTIKVTFKQFCYRYKKHWQSPVKCIRHNFSVINRSKIRCLSRRICFNQWR